jgi:hypothetical protein
MNLEELADELPWGLHDSSLERVELDYCAGRAVLHLRVPMSEHQDLDQRGRVELEGLVYWISESPTIDPAAGYHAHTPEGLWIDLLSAEQVRRGVTLPACPPGCFASGLYVSTWNACVYFAAREARLVWVETEPQPSRSDVRAAYPGGEVAL